MNVWAVILEMFGLKNPPALPPDDSAIRNAEYEATMKATRDIREFMRGLEKDALAKAVGGNKHINGAHT